MSYQERIASMGLSNKETIVNVLESEPKPVILDVRMESEIAASGKFEYPGIEWKQIACSADSAADLEAQSSTLLPNKDAPVIIYCRSGRRAMTASKALVGQGYKQVLNAGGYDDLVSIGLA
eukprot:Nitzschia sp. Nitz4//scaffold565_size2955//2218//2580//NITZ4_009280-RA/size2955-processed-gene-0.1-mRNA-1//1//CDS//3329554629//4010//frame0